MPGPGGTLGNRIQLRDLGPTVQPFVISNHTNDRTFGPLTLMESPSQAFRLGQAIDWPFGPKLHRPCYRQSNCETPSNRSLGTSKNPESLYIVVTNTNNSRTTDRQLPLPSLALNAIVRTLWAVYPSAVHAQLDWRPGVSDSSLRILIVKLSAIGDVIHGIPVLNALRDHYPNAHLSWVVEGRTAELLAGHPSLDRLITAPRKWLKNPRAVWRLRNQLHESAPQIAIDLQGLARSGIVSWLSGARTRISFAGRDGREFSRIWHTASVQPKAKHVIDRNLELLKPLGIVNPVVRFDFPRQTEICQTIDNHLRNVPFDRFAVINPGAGWPTKLWEMERFGKVAGYLGKTHGLRSLVVWAGPQEQAWAQEIVDQSSGFAQLAPPTSLCELAEVIRRSVLFVGSDTGPLHLAVAVGTPSIGIFGPVSAQRNGPYGTDHIALQNELVTGPSRKRRHGNNDAMRTVTVEDVTAACAELLDRQSTRRLSA